MFDVFSSAPSALLLLVPLLLVGTVSTGWIEVFRAGSYPQGSFTPQDIQAIADVYDPDTFESPSTVDHQQKGMAHGWVADLKAKGESLYAKFKQVPEAFAQAIKDGRLKNRSIELFRDLDGKGLYLKAVTWLGAKAPQVKGLEDPADALEFDHSGLDQRLSVLHFDEEDSDAAPDEEDEPETEDGNEDDTEEDGDDEPEGEPESDDDGEGDSDEDDELDEEDETSDSEGDGTEDFSHEAQSEIERLREENQRLRQQAEQSDQDQRVEEFRRHCEERVPPAVRDEVVAIFKAVHTSDTIQFEHDSYDDVAAAFEDVVDKLSLSYLFQEVGTEPDAGDPADTDLESAVRQSMAEQGHDV